MNWVDRQAQQEEAIAANYERLWQELLAAMAGACHSFNKHYGSQDLSVEIDTRTMLECKVSVLMVPKVALPRLNMTLDRQSKQIRVHTLNPDQELVLGFEVDNDLSCHLTCQGKRMSIEAASECLLRPMLFPAEKARGVTA